MNTPTDRELTAPSQRPSIRVFVVEDSALIRERVMSLLQSTPGLALAGYAVSAVEAIEQITRKQPDVVVLDFKLFESSGLQVLRAIKPAMPHIRVVMLTNHATPEYRKICEEAGADLFLDKTNEFEKLTGILQQLSC